MALQHDPNAPDVAGEEPAYRNWVVASLALVIGVAAGGFYGNAVIHRWYAEAFLLDFGWFNDLVSGRTLALQDPSGVDSLSYYSVHVAPLLTVFAGVSRLLHLLGPQPIALMLGVAFGGAAAMGFVVLERFVRPAGMVAALLGGAVGAVVYAGSGVMRATADYPHIEILYVPLALLTLHLLFQRRLRWAWAALAVCLLEREDAGLHLACILGAYLVLAAIEERGVPARLRELLPYLGVCLAYPALVILWQHATWEGGSTFQAIYSGVPAYRHLGRALLSERAHFLAGPGAWVVLTLLASASVLPFQRRWTALTGLLAAMPWFLLNLSAYASAPGHFQLYYAFPFLVTALAPFIVTVAAAAAPREEVLDVVAL